MAKYIGVLTAGGDSPGLNAAIRAVGKAAAGYNGMQVIGFMDGFRGLMENRMVPLDDKTLSGILTQGGTILGTSREKPHRMSVGGTQRDMTDAMAENYHKHSLDVLVCLGGGGTQKNALRLAQKGLNIITLPKTIDNDIPLTDTSVGFDTALGVATEAIDRLHSTAHSHHRMIVVEIMGHKVGWLALGAGIAGGADVILIPEIPYDLDPIAEAIRRRSKGGKRFSIVAFAEGAVSRQTAEAAAKEASGKAKGKPDKTEVEPDRPDTWRPGSSMELAKRLEELTGLESRVTILGYLQRGGTPSAADRLLATRLGTACTELVHKGQHGVMVAARGESIKAVDLDDVAGKLKSIPLDHPWIAAARRVGTCLGD